MVRFDSQQKKRIIKKAATTVDPPGFEKNILALEERIKKSKELDKVDSKEEHKSVMPNSDDYSSEDDIEDKNRDKIIEELKKKIQYLEYQLKQTAQLQRRQINTEGDKQRLDALSSLQNEKMNSLLRQELNLQQLNQQKQKQNQSVTNIFNPPYPEFYDVDEILKKFNNRNYNLTEDDWDLLKGAFENDAVKQKILRKIPDFEELYNGPGPIRSNGQQSCGASGDEYENLKKLLPAKYHHFLITRIPKILNSHLSKDDFLDHKYVKYLISKSINPTQSSGWFSNLYNKIVGGVKKASNWIRGATNKVDNFVQRRPYVRDIADEIGQRAFNRNLSPYYDRAINYSNIATDYVDNIPLIQSNGRIFDMFLNKIGSAANSVGRIVNSVKDGYNQGNTGSGQQSCGATGATESGMINPFWNQQQGDNRVTPVAYSQGFLQDLAHGIEKLFGGGLNSLNAQEYTALRSSGFLQDIAGTVENIFGMGINSASGINESSGFLQDIAGTVENIFGMGINESRGITAASGICSSCGFDHSELDDDFEQILNGIKNNRTISIEDDSLDKLHKKFDLVICYSFKNKLNPEQFLALPDVQDMINLSENKIQSSGWFSNIANKIWGTVKKVASFVSPIANTVGKIASNPLINTLASTIHPAAASVLNTVGNVANTVGNVTNKISSSGQTLKLKPVKSLPKVLQKF